MPNLKIDFDDATDDAILTNVTEGTTEIANKLAASNPDGFFNAGGGTNAVIGKGATPPVAAGANSFAQGDQASAAGDHSFAQGYDADVGADNSFAQGKDITIPSGFHNFAQGSNVTLGASVQKVFAQGQDLTSLLSSACLVQGNSNSIAAASGYSLNQGSANSIAGTSPQSFIQGRDNTIGANSSESFAQGRRNEVAGARGFAHGYRTETTRDDQKAWGANRTATLGSAQFSHMTKHVQTTDDTVTTLIDLTLEQDKAYAIWCHIITRNTTTDDEVASFFLDQATAYRDTAGVAVLVGSPTFTKEATTGGPAGGAFTVAISASSNSILIRVTGEPSGESQTYEWCGTVKFTEVLG